jgi:hypothetical protein
MKSATLSELKKELNQLDAPQLMELCISLAKYKKDNKEFLDYLLFESNNLQGFVANIKAETDEYFDAINGNNNLNNVKKSLRKILRILAKYCKYINDKAAAAELYIYFCTKLKSSGIPYYKNQVLINLYAQQLKKINTLVNSLHEDLQYDFKADIERLS